MTTLLQLLVTQSPTLLALIAVCYVLYQKIQSEATLTKERFDNVNTRIDDVNARIDDLKENVNTRIDNVNARIDDLKENTNVRLNRIDEDYRALNTKMDTRMDTMHTRIDTMHTKMDTMSAQINRIEGALSLPRTGTED
ncbi:MAG: hypothetical protein OXI88_11885 [Gammaproteobacteria bacterium]|nr:hypothetical protein [Gammaproteobacteria bacterium]